MKKIINRISKIVLILLIMLGMPLATFATKVEVVDPSQALLDGAEGGQDIGDEAARAAEEYYQQQKINQHQIEDDVTGKKIEIIDAPDNVDDLIEDTNNNEVIDDAKIIKEGSQTKVVIDGKEYTAYCIDKGMKGGYNQDATCVPLGNDTAGQAFKRLLAAATGSATDKAAMRIVGIITGYSRIPSADNVRGTKFMNSVLDELGGNKTANHEAYNRAISAIFGYDMTTGDVSADRAGDLEKEGQTASNIKFAVGEVSNGRVTIRITSTTKINKMVFAVKGGTLVSSEWKDKSGKAVIEDTDHDCNVALSVSYNGSEALLCTRDGSQSYIVDTSTGDTGAVVAQTDKEDETANTTQTFNVEEKHFEKDSGYYEEYCKKKRECEEVQQPAQKRNNCCEEGGFVDVTEPELNDLFCPDDALGVEYFKRRKGSDKYKKASGNFAKEGPINTLANNYCSVYCTQRVYMEIPTGINHAKNGLYFELEKGYWGTASAYERGTKRCRVRIDYDSWWIDYDEYIKQEMIAYNDFQENNAIYRYIDDNSDCFHNSHDTRNSNVDEVCGEPNKQTAEEYFVECVAHATKASSSCKGTNGETLTCTVTKEPVVNEVKPIPKQNIAYTFADLQHQKDYYYYKLEWDKEKKDKKYESVEVDKKKLNNKIQADSLYSYNSIGPKRVKDLIDKREEAYGQYAVKDVPSKEIESGDCGTCSKPSPPNPKWECQKSHQVIEEYAATDWVESETPWKERKQTYLDKARTASDNFHTYTEKARNMEMALDACNSYFKDPGEGPESYLSSALALHPDNGSDTKKNYKLQSTYAFDYSQIYLDPYGNLQEFVTNVPFDGGCEITPGYDKAKTIKTGATNDTPGRTDVSESYYSKNIYNKYNNMELYDDFSDKKIGKLTVDDEDSDWYRGAQPNNWYDNFLHKHVGEIKDGIFKNDKKFTLDGLYKMECKWHESGSGLNTFVPSGSAATITQQENITFHDKTYSVFLSTLKGKYDTNHHVGCIGENCIFDEIVAEGDACAKENGGGDHKKSTEAVGESAMSCALEVSYTIVLTGICNPDDHTARIETCEIFGRDSNLFEFKVADPKDILPGYAGLDYADNWKDQHGTAAYNQIKQDANADKTYAIDHLTYSFIVNPTTMKLIQSYNADAAIDGGYTDFQMSCSCGGGSKACTKCESNFITKYVNGTLINGSTYRTEDVWGNSSMSLNTVRSSNSHVHWKEDH